MTLAQWKKANPEITKYISPKYKKYRKDFFKARRENETDGGDNVKIEEIPAKLVKEMNTVLNAPEPAVRLDFNVEVDAVVRSCDENQTKIDRVQDIITDRAVPIEALVSLEEIHNALGNLKALTVKMLESYKQADEGIAVLEKEAVDVFNVKKKLVEIRATRKGAQ
jgi:hypothetical protein